MKPAALTEALIVVYTALHEVLPLPSQQVANTILLNALAEGLVQDPDAFRVLKRLVDPPLCAERKRSRALPRRPI
jgi:hypothetical protein